MKWFRVYDELVDDPKVQGLSDSLFRALMNIWCIASQNDGRLPPIDHIAFKLRVKPARAEKIVADLRERGLINEDDNGPFPHNWNGRQFKSDGASTDRVKRFRQRNKDSPGNGGETLHETFQKQPQSQRQNQKQNQKQKTEESQQHSSDSVPPERASRSLISPEAFALADEIGQIVGFTKENWPPGWAGAAYTIEKFMADGCPCEIIRLAVKAVLERRKRDGPPENFSYFAKPIAAAFANFQRPNPVQPPQAFDGRTNGHVPQKRTVIDAGRDLVAKLKALEDQTGSGSGTGDAPPRLLPPH